MSQAGVLRICGVLLVSLLSGCDFAKGVFSSPEARINEAFPVSDAVLTAKASLLNIATDAQKVVIESQLKERLDQRAHDCAKGYIPTWHSSMEDIRRAIINKNCFVETDEKIARLLGVRMLGIILSQPPLIPIPEVSPESITADGFIHDAYFAENAGVALLATPQSIEFLDIATSKLIASEAKGRGQVGMLSPNGRLYVIGDGDSLKIKQVETGSVVLELRSVMPYQFYWLDDHTVAYSKRGNEGHLLDLSSGEDLDIPSEQGYLFQVRKMQGDENRYAFIYNSKVVAIELNRHTGSPTVERLSEVAVSGSTWALNTSGQLADGRHYFSASNELTLVDAEDLTVEKISFQPYLLQTGIATPDPDKIVLTGYIKPPHGDDAIYLYSISERTLSLVDQEKIFPPRYIYIAPLRKQGIIINSKIALRDSLPTLDTTSITEFVSNAMLVSEQRERLAYDRMVAEQIMRDAKNSAGGPPPNIPIRPQEYLPRPLPPSTNTLFSDLANKVQVEGVGVYQGKSANHSFANHPMGYVEVRIRSSAKPIVLVLSSYEPVNWRLVSEPGAKLATVLISGYHSSNVVGAGTARVIVAGSASAYKLGDSGYNSLNNEVVKYIGKGIDIFQGKYEGDSFSVGGR